MELKNRKNECSNVKSQATKTILFTVDVEDWFQVENFKPWIPFESWNRRQLRVEKNTNLLLDLLDAAGEANETVGVGKKLKGTFFVLGWIAERLPHLVREIHRRGHEVASHGYSHKLCNSMSVTMLDKDLRDSKNELEDTIGSEVHGFRAPSFSINSEALRMVAQAGYRYDSSYNSFALNSRYGKIETGEKSKIGIATKICDKIFELPISNLVIGNRVIPWGGGGYFRIMPFRLYRTGVERILSTEDAFVFYMHPWEVDPRQPKVRDATMIYKFRHYANLGRTTKKIEMMLKAFPGYAFTSCRDYLYQKAAIT